MLNNLFHIIFLFTFIFLLSALRKHFLYELQALSMLLTGSHKPGLYIYTLLMFPGTVIHELSHWLTAEILQVPTGEISVLPEYSKLDEQEQRLGYVAIAKSDPIRGFFIGTAPLFTGTALLIGLSYVLGNVWSSGGKTYLVIALIYSVIVLGNTMLVSKSDRRYWPFMGVITLAIYLTLSKSSISLSSEILYFINRTLERINSAIILTLLLEICLIAVFLLIRLVLQKLTNKKIIKA